MGYNTTLVILNDALGAIENDSNFGKKVSDAVHKAILGKPVDISSNGHVNAATVIETHHADPIRVIAVGGNYAQDLGYVGGYKSKPEDILKELANQMGYRIVKKSVKKTGK